IAIETYAIVKPHQPKHREEQAYTQPCRAIEFERIVFFKISPRVGTFIKSQCIDGRGRALRKRITHLCGIFIEDSSVFIFIYFIASVCNDVSSYEKGIHGKPVAAHLETFKR